MIKINFPGNLFFGMLFILFSCSHKQGYIKPERAGLSSDTLRVAEAKMQQNLDSGKFAGISLFIMKDDKMVWRTNLGYAEKETGRPLTDSTIFRIYSMTKPVTTVALMTLFDEGKFQLDDKVSQYIPEFKSTMVYNPEIKKDSLEPQQQEMTIRHLLTHTSGLTYGWDPNSYVDRLYAKYRPSGWDAPLAEKMKVLSKLPLKYQPGTKWEYGLSIDVAGYLVEVLSGIPLDQFMKTKVFDPLKMDDTGFWVPENKQNRLAGLYFADKEGKLMLAVDTLGLKYNKIPLLFSGGGGLVSTIDDYTRFCRMLLHKGELDGARILKESTVDLIMSNQLPSGVIYKEGRGYGLGGEVNLETDVYAWSGAASTFFWVNPKTKMIVMAFMQLMPFTTSYAIPYKQIVDKALLNPDIKN